MKRLRFTKLLLLSLKEKAARKVEFHPRMTLIKGDNDSGKSCLLKSIYRAMGAETPNIPQKFKDIDVISLLFFTLDGEEYKILRYGDDLTLFDTKDTLIRFPSITKDLGPHFAHLFNFKLLLKTHKTTDTQATPAFLFLPFYLDQDKGWIEIFNSFEKLSQFTKWKSDFIKFHTGICPSEYFEEKSKKDSLAQKRNDLETRKNIVQSTMQNIDRRLKSTNDFDLDIKNYTEEITLLLKEAADLKLSEDKEKQSLSKLNNNRSSLIAQIKTLESAVKDLRDDYKYAETSLPDTITCPFCHTTHENSFAARFELKFDEVWCQNVLSQLEKELLKNKKNTDRINLAISNIATKSTTIKHLLTVKKNGVGFQDIIRSEGRKEVVSSMKDELAQIDIEYNSILKKIADCTKAMLEFENTAHKKQIEKSFIARLHEYFHVLNLDITSTQYNKLLPNFSESGSDMTRVVLAYFYTVINVINEYSTSTFCPIVIDSPRQKDIDDGNWNAMLEFIRDKLPTEAQCILGLVENGTATFPGDSIILTEKYKLLKEEEFTDVSATIMPMLAQRKNEFVLL